VRGAPWTQAEDAVLRSYYPYMATWKVARMVKRGTQRVRARASKLGLAKSVGYMASEEAYRFRRGGEPAG